MHRPAFESLLFAVALAVGLTPEFLPMITTVTLAQGAVADGQGARHRQAPLGHPEPRQHRHPVQRQDRNAHAGRDAARGVLRCRRPTERSAPGARAAQQPLRDRDPEPARFGDPGARPGRRRRELEQARRDAVRLRAAPPVGRREEPERQPPDHQGRPRLASAPCAGETLGSRAAVARLGRSGGRERAAGARGGDEAAGDKSQWTTARRARARPAGLPHLLGSPAARGQPGGGRAAQGRRLVKIFTGDDAAVAGHVCGALGHRRERRGPRRGHRAHDRRRA